MAETEYKEATVIKEDRYAGVDALKCVCALMVVCLHTIPYCHAPFLIAICRIAVPIFFMITGFFYPCNNVNRQNLQIKKIVRLCIVSVVVYSAYYTIMEVKSGKFITDWFVYSFGHDSILDFLFFNQIKGIGHLWYLYALLYALFVIKFFRIERLKNKRLIVPVLILLCSGYFISFTDYPYWYYRNWLFEGIPFILLGIIVRRYISYYNKKILYMLFSIGILLLPFELSIQKTMGGQKNFIFQPCSLLFRFSFLQLYRQK